MIIIFLKLTFKSNIKTDRLKLLKKKEKLEAKRLERKL